MASPRLQASHCFAFEHDFVGSWRCIPLCVRRKLDLIGLKLKLSHWLELSQAQRQELVDWPDQAEALQQLRTQLQTWTRPMADGEARPLPVAVAEPWQRSEPIPDQVQRAAQQRQVALSAQQWAELGELERFALCKLARPGHDHHNLEAAFAELLPPRALSDGSLGHQRDAQSEIS
ncbi:nitrate reductase associated protein [Vulcanococcus sp.]|jgi:hypothetical protein|uniref:nitrate reductase associated protein n=1 Tax=Vulcanococcus sp. TaxID=2856995 RepID=UPI0037DA2894